MATLDWPGLPDLAARIAADPAGHHYYQLVRMLEHAWGAYDTGGTLEANARFRPAPEINFPVSDVRRVVQGEKGRMELELNFGGLYGVDAALPHYFLQLAMRSDEAGECTRAFLDVFCHRFYTWLYRGWKKCHPSVDLENPASRYFVYLSALMGRDSQNVAVSSFQFSGLLGSRARSATGLHGMLQELLSAPVELEQFVPRWVTINKKTPLGTAALGQDTVVGEQVLDVGGAVVVKVGPVTLERALALLPGSGGGQTFGQFMGEYLGPLMSYDMRILVEGASGNAPALGSEGLRLGWRAWLGEACGQPYELTVSGADFTPALAA